jgi:sigma-E factor negative regulatory protein RseA
MTANPKELLSALVDGELKGKELEQALDLIHSDEQAKQRWLSYQQTSDILHGHKIGQQNIDLSRLISDKLVDEPSYTAETKKAKILAFPQQFWRQAAGLAVAASIGALAVVGVMEQPTSQFNPNPQIASNEVAKPVLASAQSGKRWTVGQQDVEQRLDNYLVDHNEYTGASGVFSYARVVSYDAGQ